MSYRATQYERKQGTVVHEDRRTKRRRTRQAEEEFEMELELENETLEDILADLRRRESQ